MTMSNMTGQPENDSNPRQEDLNQLRRRMIWAVGRSCPFWLRDQAEDIVQDALCKLQPFFLPGGKVARLPMSYLRKAAYHATIDAIRVQRHRLRETSVDSDEQPIDLHSSSGDPERECDARRRLRALRQAMEAIPRNQQIAVSLHLQGHSVPEIGQLIGWSKTRANNLVYRGLKNLRRRMTPPSESLPSFQLDLDGVAEPTLA